MESFITLDANNIESEHICCAISDKKCAESYALKKQWLKNEFGNGYVFRRIDARAKVFIEYGPAEKAWVPVDAPNYLLINCFWVAGQYKGKGYGKELLASAIADAKNQGKAGLVTVAGEKKFPFMSDTKWLMRQGFQIVEKLASGICLLALKLDPNQASPAFKKCVTDTKVNAEGLVVYYSNRCPFTEFHVKNSLAETVNKRNIKVRIEKLETMEQAQNAPTPATIFSIYYNGQFVTTDISACIDSRFDKIVALK